MLKKLFNRFKNTKLHVKLLFSYGIVVLLPVLLIGYILINRNTAIALDQMNSINEGNFRQLKNNIGNKLSEYTQITNSFSAEKQLMDYFNGIYPNYDEGEKYLAYSNIDLIYRRKFDSVELWGANLSFYTSNKGIMASSYVKEIDNNLMQQQWYIDTMDAKGANSIGNPYRVGFDQFYIPVSRILDSGSGFTSLIRLDIPQTDLYSLFENESANKTIYIFNKDNCIISSSDERMLGKYPEDVEQIESPMLDGLNGLKSFNTADGKSVVYSDSIRIPRIYGECKIVEIVSTSDMLAKISENVRNSILICIISVTFTMILVMIFSNTLTRRIRLLVRNMSKIRDGSFEVFVDCEQNDEIGELSNSFKSMVERIDRLVKEVYEADINIKNLELKRKEAELHALLSQINPHFLFNTMESIRMNLLKSGETTVSEVIKNFAMLLRKSINWADDNITVKKELELAEAYLKIQKFRYKDKLEYEIKCAPELSEFIIPKFSVQPLVENAIYHGIELKEGPGRVVIDLRDLGEDIRIDISDNGIGMSEEKEVKLLSENNEVPEDDSVDNYKSIGIQNVNQRLKMNFGMKYGLKIKSLQDIGTKVEMLLPKTLKGD